MRYKVFLVEDEVVTREGIRDTVDWGAAGYEFCGEASDGELALPLIREQQPETVISDIKMPFMDGLQLCRILREVLPTTKLIILSGHDEFRYAQEAIQIGVTEYLLKPVAPQDLLAALRRVAHQIDEERESNAQLQALQSEMATHRSVVRERCLLALATGDLSSADFMEQAQTLDINLLARWYQVLLIRTVSPDTTTPSYSTLHPVDTLIARTISDPTAWVSFKNGIDETVLILKGDTPDILARRAQRLCASLLQSAEQAEYRLVLGMGEATERLGTIAHSFAQARAQVNTGEHPKLSPPHDSLHDLPQTQNHSTAMILKARSYMDAHYADPDLSLNEVAKEIALSPTYFSVVFSRTVGESFVEYLTNIRIRKAIELLQTTSLAAGEIAYRVGYQNPRYFYAVFRKVVGRPPKDFRRWL
jgi:two-component system response regulator YesN